MNASTSQTNFVLVHLISRRMKTLGKPLSNCGRVRQGRVKSQHVPFCQLRSDRNVYFDRLVHLFFLPSKATQQGSHDHSKNSRHQGQLISATIYLQIGESQS